MGDTKITAEFTQTLNFADLTLTKELYEDNGTELSNNKNVDFEFTVELDFLGGTNYKPYSLRYQLDGETLMAVKGGEVKIKPGKTITFTNIPVGASYIITESDKAGYELNGTVNPATGTITDGGLSVTFKNKEIIIETGISAAKTFDGKNYTGDEFTFNAELVKFIKADGSVITGNELKKIYADSAISSITDGKIDFAKFSIVASKENAGEYIFKLSETKGTNTDYVYDAHSYYAKIVVSENNVENAMYYTDEACETLYGEDGTTPPTFRNVTATVYTDIEFKKVDGDRNPMQGVEFEIFSDEDCTDKITAGAIGNVFGVNGTVITDENGKAIFENVQYSRTEDTFYYIKETKTLDGYQLLAEPIVVKIDKDGNVTISYDDSELDNNTVVNVKQPELPVTGAAGVYNLFALGALIAFIGCLVLVTNKKRAKTL